MTWNKQALKGTLWDPKRKKTHPDNQEIKDLLKQAGITQQEASEMLRIPVSRLRKNLNSWYPMPEYLRQELLGIIRTEETVERAWLRRWVLNRLPAEDQQEEKNGPNSL